MGRHRENPELAPLKAKALELKAQGVPLRKIAEIMGMKEGRINYYVYGHGGSQAAAKTKVDVAAVATAKADSGRTAPGRHEENATLLPQIASLKKEGYTVAEMAKKLNITYTRASYLGTKAGREGIPVTSNGHGELPSDLERHVSFAAGHISAWLEVYADSLNVPRRSLSEGVMGVLKARR